MRRLSQRASPERLQGTPTALSSLAMRPYDHGPLPFTPLNRHNTIFLSHCLSNLLTTSTFSSFFVPSFFVRISPVGTASQPNGSPPQHIARSRISVKTSLMRERMRLS